MMCSDLHTINFSGVDWHTCGDSDNTEISRWPYVVDTKLPFQQNEAVVEMIARVSTIQVLKLEYTSGPFY